MASDRALAVVYLTIAFVVVATHRRECVDMLYDCYGWYARHKPRKTRLTGKLAADVAESMDNAGR